MQEFSTGIICVCNIIVYNLDMKTTKEQLVKTNEVLANRLKVFEEEDLSRKKVLSELLGSYTWENEYGYISKTKKVDVKDWLGIAFLIGELKSDAGYSRLLESKNKLHEENEILKFKLQEIQFPKTDETK